MKNRIIAILICCCLIICLVPGQKANADGPSITMIASAAYAMLNQWGVGVSVQGGTAAGVEQAMVDQVQDYVNRHGGSIIELFGEDVLRMTAGRLAMGQQMYNGIRNFVRDFLELNEIGDAYVCTEQGSIANYALGVMREPPAELQSTGFYSMYENPYGNGVYKTWKVYNGQTLKYTYDRDNYGVKPPYWFDIRDTGGTWWVVMKTGRYYSGGRYIADNIVNCFTFNYDRDITDRINMTAADYTEPDIMDMYHQYLADILGVTAEGIPIDDVIEGIYVNVADNTLDVDGEIVDIAPPPTPAPVPPSPYPQASTELDGINTNIEQLNDMLQDAFELQNQLDTVINSGNATVDGLNDLIGQSQDVIEGINDLNEELEGVGIATESIAASVEAVESLTESISAAMDIIDSSDASEYKFDLRNLFPFCIPFDVVRLLKSFDSTTSNVTAPHLRIPVNFGSVVGVYTFDLDFSPFDPVATILRQVEFILFAIGLAIATQKMIKW